MKSLKKEKEMRFGEILNLIKKIPDKDLWCNQHGAYKPVLASRRATLELNRGCFLRGQSR